MLPSGTARWDYQNPQRSPDVLAYHVFSASDHLFGQLRISSTVLSMLQEGIRDMLFSPTNAANRVLGGHIPSSAPPLSGRLSFCSGERLLFTPRGLSFGALIADELGSTDTDHFRQHVLSKY